MFLRDAEGSAEPLTFELENFVLLIVLLVPTIALGLYFGPLVEFAQYSVAMFGVK